MTADEREEKILDARIVLSDVVRFPSDDWQKRYCKSIDKIADYHGITSDELSGAWMAYTLAGRIPK